MKLRNFVKSLNENSEEEWDILYSQEWDPENACAAIAVKSSSVHPNKLMKKSIVLFNMRQKQGLL